MTKPDLENTLRIIGGNWRSRKVSFADQIQIRPTPARVRETLFNWLQYHIAGSRCLELYAGSGILSLEALSRGARHVTLVDAAASICSHLHGVLQALAADPQSYSCSSSTALAYLQANPNLTPFDLIFLDPPFDSKELSSILPLLAAGKLVTEDGFVYIESAAVVDQQVLPEGWQIHRQKRAAGVHYCLCRPARES